MSPSRKKPTTAPVYAAVGAADLAIEQLKKTLAQVEVLADQVRRDVEDRVAKAGADMVETDIPSSMLSTLVDLGVKAKEQPMSTIELTPEGANIDPDDPDYEHIHALVQETLHPQTASPTP